MKFQDIEIVPCDHPADCLQVFGECVLCRACLAELKVCPECYALTGEKLDCICMEPMPIDLSEVE